jgi:cytochrome b561
VYVSLLTRSLARELGVCVCVCFCLYCAMTVISKTERMKQMKTQKAHVLFVCMYVWVGVCGCVCFIQGRGRVPIFIYEAMSLAYLGLLSIPWLQFDLIGLDWVGFS